MGLLDILNGMQNGPRGQPQPKSGSSSSGGMSKMTMALLGLLAYKAFKSFTGGPAAAPGKPSAAPTGAGHVTPPSSLPSGSATSAGVAPGNLGDILGGLFGGKPGSVPASGSGQPGNLNDLLKGGLGGLLGGAAAGTVVSGGLDKIIKDLQASGNAKVADSWVGNGPNHDIAPKDLANALGGDAIDEISKRTGMEREDLLSGLSQNLPELVDKLTPNGRLPTAEEANRMI